MNQTTTLYVGNMSFYTTEEQIYELFGMCGEVKRVVMGNGGLGQGGNVYVLFWFVLGTYDNSLRNHENIQTRSQQELSPLGSAEAQSSCRNREATDNPGHQQAVATVMLRTTCAM